MTDPPRPTPARLLAIALGTAVDPDPVDRRDGDPSEATDADD